MDAPRARVTELLALLQHRLAETGRQEGQDAGRAMRRAADVPPLAARPCECDPRVMGRARVRLHL